MSYIDPKEPFPAPQTNVEAQIATAKKQRKPRAPKKPAPKPKHKALIMAIAALVVAATDFYLTLRYGLKLF